MSQATTLEGLLKFASGKYQRKDYQGAIEAFHKALAIKEDWNAYLGLGWALTYQQKFTSAIEAFQKSIALKEDWNSYLGLGYNLNKKNRYPEAIEAISKSLTLKKNWQSYHQMGTLLYKTNQFENSIQAFEEALKQKKDWATYRELGSVLYKTGNFKGAIKAYKISLSTKENWGSYRGLGCALNRDNQFEDAIKALRKSIEIKKDWITYRELGSALYKNNKTEEAIIAFQNSLDIKVNWASYKGLGCALYRNKQYIEAIDNFEKSIGMIEEWNAYLNLGWAQLKTNKYESAIESFRKSLLIVEDWKTYQGLGFALIKHGRIKQGINSLRNSLALKEDKKTYIYLSDGMEMLKGLGLGKDSIPRITEIKENNEHNNIEMVEDNYPNINKLDSRIYGTIKYFCDLDYEQLKTVGFTSNDNYNSLISKTKESFSSLEYYLIKEGIITNIIGVHNSEGIPYEESILERGKGTDFKDFPLGVRQKLDLSIYPSLEEHRTAIWIRYLNFKHFGHALTEMCACIYPLLFWAEGNFSLNKITIIIPDRFRAYKNKLSKLLDISSKNILHVGEGDLPIRVGELMIPKPTMVLRNHIRPEHARVVSSYLSLYKKNIQNIKVISTDNDYFTNKTGQTIPKYHPRRIYMSRSKLNNRHRKFREENEIEKNLIEYGWTIIYPEKTTFSKQIKLYENTEFIAGTEGSGFHLLMGIKNPRLKLIILSKKIRDQEEDMQINLELQFKTFKTEYTSIKCLEVTGEKWGAYKDVKLSKEFTSKSIAKFINNISL